MLNALRAKNPGRPIPAILFYEFSCSICSLVLMVLYRFRVHHRTRVPRHGPLLVVANHQSHFDPVISGVCIFRPRHMNFLAKSDLFGFGPFKTLISALNAVPLKQDTSDIGAIRVAIEQLKLGRAVLIFPEGSRTPDGAMHPFKRGAWVLMTRSKATVLPIAIEGAFDAFPRSRSFPYLTGRRIAAMVGEPIAHETLAAMGADRGLAHLAQTIETMREELARRLTSEGFAPSTKPLSAEELDD